jgi:hypothetical protein
LIDEIGKLMGDLDSELASLGSRMALAQGVNLRTLLNYTRELERWLSRAKALDGDWQAEMIDQVRAVSERLREGRSMDYGLEHMMRLVILASEHLDLSRIPMEPEKPNEKMNRIFKEKQNDGCFNR